ncbi:MAG: VWA domain-containing protein [Myxococcales bacterium]|nr:VWA domain-containing protein [Myxococcales bacterium]
MAFDTQAKVFVRPQRASNRMRIASEIATLRAGGGTNIYPGLRDAFELLQNINAKVKHVILLSDGQAPTDGLADLVRDMRASRITVSAVGVAGASRSLLQMIVDAGDGRLYMVEDIGSLPRIFMKETTEVQKSQLVEDLVAVRVAKRVEAIEGTGVEAAPPLRGYVTTKPKPTAEVILVSDLGEPILARWRHGTGTSVAWTSDVKNRWGSEWIKWSNYPKFWAQVVRSTMRRKTYDSYDLSVQVAGGVAHVTVDAIDASEQFVNELDTELTVIDPATGKALLVLPMQQTAAGRYGASFGAGAHLRDYGSFLLKATHKRGGSIVAESLGSLALPYPPEFETTAVQQELLASVSSITAGRPRAAASDALRSAGGRITYTQDVWGYFLIAAAALFLLDLYAKRVRLFSAYRTLGFDDSAP